MLMETTSFGWLHLTDLHIGMQGQGTLLPSVEKDFLNDVDKLHAKCGPWDLIIFTGDLVQQGKPEEFDLVNVFLSKLWQRLQSLGSSPYLLALPGNHDLTRPTIRNRLEVEALKEWRERPDHQNEFWTSPNSRLRRVVNKAFANYLNWLGNHPFPRLVSHQKGILPGDFSAVLDKDGIRLGFVGLNSTFVQLAGGDYQGYLAIGLEQFHSSCGGNGVDWLDKNHINVLLTHQPPGWLEPSSRTVLAGEIYRPSAFAAHMFGHMHDSRYLRSSIGGADYRREWQGASLFGLEHFGETSDRVKRRHGYSAGRIDVDQHQATLRFWPRKVESQQSGHLRLIPDYSFDLNDDQSTKPEIFSVTLPLPTAPQKGKRDSKAHIYQNRRAIINVPAGGHDDRRLDFPSLHISTVPPPPPQGTIGRRKQLSDVLQMLKRSLIDENDMAPIALCGMGGIGKTTLAASIGRNREVQELFPDGVLWTALGPEPAIRILLNNLGDILGIDLKPELDEAACTDRLRNSLQQRRLLLIVDDVWKEKDGEYFTLGGSLCRILVTTREPPVAYHLATRKRTLEVKFLTPASSLSLLHKLAFEAVNSHRDTAKKLCENLGFLPLALTLAGRLLAMEADIPSRMRWLMGELLEKREARLSLLQEEGRLGLAQDHAVSLQAILGMSVERLDRLDQERFAMLSMFGGEPLNWKIEESAYVWDCSIVEAEATTSRYIQRGLISRRGDYYWMHALLADYAAEMLERMCLS